MNLFHRMSMMAQPFRAIIAGLITCLSATGQDAEVRVITNHARLQKIFDSAVAACHHNEARMTDGREVLVEGDIWRGLWLETQPMGGAMFAKFDLKRALNNIEIVIEGQRDDGLLPHLTHLDGTRWYGTGLPGFDAIGFNSIAHYGLDMHYLLRGDPAFLNRLESALEKYDRYLWANRDKNGNGLLEAWCTTDTGEDGQAGVRFDLPRDPDGLRFVESVSVMADSHANRAILAEIALLKGDTKRCAEWRSKADALRETTRRRFWDPDRHAAFDLDSHGKVLPALNQLNLRAMAQGLFYQDMADEFVKHHLMNPREFFTPYPIPSTAVNDPLFRNVSQASEYATWAGPSMGLTLQRSVRALENYGHHAEIVLIGNRLLDRIGREPVTFPVQFDPIAGSPVAASGPYGPMALATLEYFSRMHGVFVHRDKVVWSGLPLGKDERLEYIQRLHGTEFRLVILGGRFTGQVNGARRFDVPAGLRVVTDRDGRVIEIAGICDQTVSGPLDLGGMLIEKFKTGPNGIHRFEGGKRDTNAKR